MGDDLRSKETCEKAIELGYNVPQLFLEYGSALTRMGIFKTAQESFEEVIRMDPDHAEAHYLIGKLYINMGNSLKAREHLRKFLEIGSTDEAAVRNAHSLLE
jgi:tetratricopeptide (TPR) repeat protein